MRRLTLPVAILVALAFAAGAAASPIFVLKGSGWGHGVGMSQYGALGRALDGQSYKQILGFYYDGTTVGPGGQKKVRVLLTAGRSALRISSDAAFKVGGKKLAANTAFRVVPTKDGRVRVVGKGKFGSPVTASPKGELLRLDGARYRGSFRIHNHSGKLDLVNVVGLQGYLFSVVPREMPASFAAEALRAQAVAARSYAVRTERAGWYDLYDDTRDQVYGGYESGEPAAAVAAVKATAGEVVLYNGAVASTFFSSSNGGRTAASADTWGGVVPYLRSRKDPADLNPANPNRSWTVTLSARALRSRLGAGKAPLDAVVSSRVSGRVNRIRFERGAWSQTLTGGPEHFRSALGLRSSRFTLGVLRLTASRTKVACNGRVRLNLLVRNVGSVTLQRRTTGSSAWKNMAVKKVDSDEYTATARPCRGTTFRLHSPDASGSSVFVKVTPRIVFRDTQPAGGLRGLVSPLSLAGRTVHVTRERKDGTWKGVAAAVVRQDGKWRADFNVVEGVYRARINPPDSSGLVTGYSPKLTVKLS
ncbi:MAG TPA: SpoIID/LytB domain-containing protein [Gaiellaceae bacterium]|nr:SpoIID/LytB domain-containing protein [Gaiellaceae bacterium]